MLKKYAPILLFGLLFLALSVRLNSLDDPHLLEFDTVYFHRVAEQIAQTGRFEPNDATRYYPDGWDSRYLKPLPPYSVVALCKLSGIFGGGVNPRVSAQDAQGCDPKFASKWYAPFFGVMMVIAMAYLGYRASGDYIISAALLAFLPGILFRSASGFTDKDTAALFFMIFSLYFAYRVLREKTASVAVLQGIFGGVAMGLATISMSSYILYLLPVAAFAAIQMLRKRINESLLGFIPFLSLPLFVLLTIDYKLAGFNAITDYHSMMVFGAAVLIAVSYWIFDSRRFAHASGNRKLGYALAIFLVLGLIGLYGTGRNVPALIEDVVTSLGNPVRGSTHASSVGEQQPTSWAWPWQPGWQGRSSFWDQTRYLFFVSPLILVIAFLSRRDEDVLTASLFFFNIFVASKAIRLMVTFAPIAALAGGQVFSFAFLNPAAFFAILILPVVGGSLLNYFTLPNAAIFLVIFAADILVGRFILQKAPKNNAIHNAFKVLVILAAIFIVFNLYQVAAEQAKYIHTSVNQEWYEDFKWINLNTKQNAPVVTWWDYGYWIQYFARRPSVADGENTGPGAVMNTYLGQFFTEQNETRAIDWLTGVCAMDTSSPAGSGSSPAGSGCARLVTFDATMIGKMYWASKIAWDAKPVWTPKLVGHSISYSTFTYAGNQETPFGTARIYAAPGGEVFLARLESNDTVIPLIIYPASGGQATVSDILTPYGVFPAGQQRGLQVIPGGVYFAGNMAIFMPPEAENNIFTLTFIMDAIPPRCAGFELKDVPGGKFCEVFNNGFTKTFMV